MSTATQHFVDIQEIRDGVVILKDGSMKAVIMTSPTNLALKSQDEQQATLSSFQSFLNSLEYPTEIVVQSRKLDISPYIESLQDNSRKITNDLLRIQAREYIDFIQLLGERMNLVTKYFYVVVSYYPSSLAGNKKGGGMGDIFKIFNQAQPANFGYEEFQVEKAQLDQRVAVIIGGLERMGLPSKELNTEELIVLYQNVYNPSQTQKALSNK